MSQYLNNDLIFYYEIFRTYTRDSLTHNLQILWLYKIISQNYDDFAKNDTFLKLTMCYYAFLIFDEKVDCGPVNTIKLMWTILSVLWCPSNFIFQARRRTGPWGATSARLACSSLLLLTLSIKTHGLQILLT